MIEEEIFLRRWRGAVPDDVLQRCLEEGRRRGNIIHAYLCVYDYLRPPRRAATPPPATPAEAPPAEVRSKPEPAAERRVKPRRIPWQFISSIAAFALSAINPLLGLLALPVAALLFSTRRNTVPMWTDDSSLIWLGRRYRFYRVELVFRDINGMGPRELVNTLLSVTRVYNGVYFKEGRAWVLLRDGADVEEARTTLRRFGVLVAQRPDPPPLKLSRVSPTPYYAMSLLPLAAALVNPVSAVTAGLAVILQLALTARDAGHAPADAKPISENLLYLSVPDPEAVWAMARASQPLVDEVLLVWEEDKRALQKIEKAGAGLERWAYWLASAWRMYRLANVQVARTRILNNREQGFEVNGLVRGSLAAFSTGIPRDVVPAFTLDLAEVSPFALLVTPSQCGEKSVRLGADDAGRDFCVDLDRIVVPHAIFIGATGSGKTTTAMSFAKQLARLGVRTVAIDPHAHWSRFPGAHVVDAREHAPPIQTIAEEDIDLLLDVLRAAGIQVLDVHFTVLLNAVQRCGGSASLRQLPECLLKVRDLSNAWAVDAIYGRLYTLAQLRAASVPAANHVVVHTGGDTGPSARMRLLLWLLWAVTEAKRTCPKPPCPTRWYVAVDEAHSLMANASALAAAYRELRKFGVYLALMTQSVRDIPRAILENTGLVVILPIKPEAVAEVAELLAIDRRVVERVAYESIPDERVAVVRVEGRAPVYVRIQPV